MRANFNKVYLSLWILLSVAFCAFVAFSFSDNPSIMGLKKASFKEVLLAHSENMEDNIPMVQDTVRAIEQEKLLPQLDSVPKNIFLFGDSMTLNIALRMAKYAAQNGHQFHAVNWDSSNTKLWADTDTLRYYLNKFKPDYVFICLGSNEVYFKNPNVRAPYVKQILQEIGDRQYVWIGPPNWNKDTGINDMLEKLCGNGHFFRSEGIELERKADKIHPTKDASAFWVDSLMRWMGKASHPILSDIPSDTLRHVKSNIRIIKAWNN